MTLNSMSPDGSWGGAAPTARNIQLPPSAPKTTSKPKTTSSSKSRTTSSSKSRTTSSSSRSSSSSSSSSSSGGIKKSSDKAQVAALEELLTKGFKSALDKRLANIDTAAKQGDEVLMAGYNARLNVLEQLGLDNEKAEGGASWANLSNRAREASDILTEIATQGAGETDQLQAQLIAARNWAANQQEVNRSFYDSQSSNFNALTDLNADTRSARYNLANQSMSDREQAWATYQNQMSDASTQLGNIYSNPYSDSYKTDSKAAWQRMVDTTKDVWTNPGVSDEVRNWQGTSQPRLQQLNNARLEGALPAVGKARRPEGSTLRWRQASSSGPGSPDGPVGISGPGGQTGSGPGRRDSVEEWATVPEQGAPKKAPASRFSVREW